MSSFKLYSWKDIERYCWIEHNIWEDHINSFDVYPYEIIVYAKESSPEIIDSVLTQVFGSHYDTETRCVMLDLGNISIPVEIQESENVYEKNIRPLFSDVLYRKSSYPHNLPDLSHHIIAFHSYKGGVGRTLSLLAFAKAWSEVFCKTENERLLIIDSDIEAPGLSWLKETDNEDAFSYLDLLTLIQDNNDIESIVNLACSKLSLLTLPIETSVKTVEHVFIPTYRYKEQLLDIYASPDTIINGKNKEYILADILDRICQHMNLGGVLVDLRAGLSQLSSTLLLDPRVKKYLVTSTSTQSIKGTELLLENLIKGLPIQENTLLPDVLLNMVTDTIPFGEKEGIINSIYACYEQGEQVDENVSLTDNTIIELPFASELIHTSSLQQILQNLDGRKLFLTLKKLVEEKYKDTPIAEAEQNSAISRDQLLLQIHDLAEKQLTAESSEGFDMLLTGPLKYLGKKFGGAKPNTVIMGAKGAGKTFLFRKMIEALSWNTFCSNVFGDSSVESDVFFLPVLASKNSINLVETLKKCIDNLNTHIKCVNVDEAIYYENQKKIAQQKGKDCNWALFWENMLASSINPEWTSFQDADTALRGCGKNVVFLIDGLEEILTQVSTSEEERKAIQALCQDTITVLSAKYKNLSIIVFLRRDIAQAAITVNFTQFEQTYKNSELKWSSTEALRLAVWLVNQAHNGFYEEPEIGIDVASQEIIDRHLNKLWGLKLGKSTSNEAYSSRWILAALSDFNGQLQARDIIRFLKNSTASTGKKPAYDDRIIMPPEVRKAVADCSTEKIAEVKQEYSTLKPILEKLEKLPESQKALPLDPSHANLSAEEEKNMILEGYLKRDGEQYYLPEIVRHALGFKYSKGARPKVLALTLKQ